jgi:hypothetical protein
MAFDTAIADILRDALAGLPVQEKKMFGGLAFMLRGHMLCGALGDGAMFRVGAPSYAAALALEGVDEMQFTGRPMTGFVQAGAGAVDDETLRGQLLDMALGFVNSLPPK